MKPVSENRDNQALFPAKRLALIIILSLTLSATFSACGAGGRNVLTFLFDGVPEEDTTSGGAVDSVTDLRGFRAAERQARMDSVTAANQMQMHQPYADKKCSICHTMPDRGESGRNLSFNFGSDGETSFMRMPVETLCITCHEDKSAMYAEEQGLSIHSPVEDGECLTCHQPHRSRFAHLLNTETARELCLGCHDESIPEGEDDHPELDEDDDCTECHNPHMSEDEFLMN